MNTKKKDRQKHSRRTLAVVHEERELARISGKLLRSLLRDKNKIAAEWFKHQQNKETILQIIRVLSAFADLKNEKEIPSDFFTTRHLMRVSMQIMEQLEGRTGDPMALFRRLRERERILAQRLKAKDRRIIEIARLDRDIGFLFTTLLCIGLNYARFMLKGGIIGRALTRKRLIAEFKEVIESVEKIPDEVGRRITPLSRQISRNTEAVGVLSHKFFGVTDDKGKVRTATNAERIDKAVDSYYDNIGKGIKPHKAITEACASVESEHGLGDYKNFETFRNMVNRIIARKRRKG